MTSGPQFARLDRAVSGAAEDAIEGAATEWAHCTQILTIISRSLLNASPQVKEEIGGQTGPAVDAAFHRSSQGMTAKAQELVKGAEALRSAAGALRRARQERDQLAASAPTPPGPYTPPVGQPTEADLQAKAQHKAAEDQYAATMADHERRAQKQNEELDASLAHSTAVMKEIHGEKEYVPPPGSSDGGGGGASGGGGSTPLHHATAPSSSGPAGHSGPTWVPHHQQHPTPTIHGDPGVNQGPGGPGDETAAPGTGAAQGGTTVDYPGSPGIGGLPGGLPAAPSTSGGGLSGAAGLGVAGAAAGGIGGGLLGTGLAAGGIRGGLTPIVTNPGTATSGVRGIGSTARTGVSGALGRSGAAAVGSGGRGTTARTGATTSRSGGTGRGSRGAAGRRGAGGSAAGGRGGRSKDEKKKGREDLFDAAEDWVDDEDAAPGVLD